MEKLEQELKTTFNGRKFIEGLKASDLLKELGPEASRFRFDVGEVVSNLDRMLSQIFYSWQEINEALDDALSGERASLTPIQLPQEIKEKLRDLIVEKIKKTALN